MFMKTSSRRQACGDFRLAKPKPQFTPAGAFCDFLGGGNSHSAKRSGPLSVSLAALCLCVTAAHADSAQGDSHWPAHNRYVAIYLGQKQQNYRELDTQGLTSNGILNTETGSQQHLGADISYQTTKGWLFGLDAQRQTGATTYSGYLQAGNGSLSPYAASTGNVSTQYSVHIGYALNADTWRAMPNTWQVTPLLQLAQHQWQRNLVQYSETYSFSSHAWGALVQWQAQAGTVLEVQFFTGYTQPAQVSAPALGFAATQAGGSLSEWRIGVTQDLQTLTGSDTLASWRVVARYTQSQYAHGLSPIVNGLQAPPNQHQPGTWVLGVQKQF